MSSLGQREFIIFDVETTGLSPSFGDRMIEVAAVKVKDSKIIGKFESLINPLRDVPPSATQVNGISGEMLKGKATADQVLPDFYHFLGDASIIGHNIKFDLDFLCYELSLLGLWLKDETAVIDTMKIARTILPHLKRFSLWFLADSLGIKKEQKHRAMEDVLLTYDTLLKLVEAGGKEDVFQLGLLPGVLEEYRAYKNVARSKQQGVFNW